MNQIPISGLFLGGLTSYAAAGLFGLAAYQHRRATRIAFCVFACLGALLEGIAALAAILDVHETLISIPSGVPFLQYTFRLDPLSCYFNLALAVVSLAVSVYSLGYLDGFDVRKPLGIFCFFYSLLLISLTVVFTANNAFLFLIAWEVMALSAYFLVSFDHERDESRKGGILFFVMSHVGTGALMVGFLLLGTWAGSFDFSAFHFIGATLTPIQQGSLFHLVLSRVWRKSGHDSRPHLAARCTPCSAE